MAGNLAVRRIFGIELQEVTSFRRKLHTEELRDLSGTYDTCGMKSRRVRLRMYVARTKQELCFKMLTGNPEGNRVRLENIGLDKKIILKWCSSEYHGKLLSKK